MAEPVYLWLKIDGNDIRGECTITGLEESIECHSFNSGIIAPYDPTSFAIREPRQYKAVKVLKLTDKTTPILIEALCRQSPVIAEFWFYRPSLTGAGDLERYFTVILEESTIVSFSQNSEEAVSRIAKGIQQTNTPRWMIDEIEFSYRKIIWTYEDGGITYEHRMR